jgi:DNA polymerase III epsilon subunit-like protein
MTPVAVVDVETTGLNPYRHDRVVEVAAVIVSPETGVQGESEQTSRTNPLRRAKSEKASPTRTNIELLK